MRYYYEYKYKSGCKTGGHNLENIIIRNNKIILNGVDILLTNYGEDYRYWTQILDMSEIEYLKIKPMLEKENN